MNESQAAKIIELLTEILGRLEAIEYNTTDISTIESNTSETVKYIKKLG